MDPRNKTYFDPFEYRNRPQGVNTSNPELSLPKHADYPWGSTSVIVEAAPRTSIFLIIMSIVLTVIFILVLIYLLWFMYVKTKDQGPTDFFNFLFRKQPATTS